LHRHAGAWTPPVPDALRPYDTPLCGVPDRTHDLDLTDAQREVFRSALALGEEAFRQVDDGRDTRTLHADLHGGNLKWHDGHLAVLDFDDCARGVPVLDLAITTFYLRGDDPAVESALRAGYETVAPLPDVAPAHFEALVAARQLLLLNDLVGSTTAQMRSMRTAYVPLAVERLEHWLSTGRFTRSLPPLSEGTGCSTPRASSG
jgi:Ser/Thr protein kinase RdoA (MazF antagonist)